MQVMEKLAFILGLSFLDKLHSQAVDANEKVKDEDRPEDRNCKNTRLSSEFFRVT